jgi:uncharacterized membrane protein YoaK (UPF0700 family)
LAERRDGEAAVDPHTVRALLALTLTAGMIDAIAFLGLEQVFAANMTGNLIVLGLAIAGAPALSVGGPLAALAAFLLGADRRAESRQRRLPRMVRIEALAIALAALVAMLSGAVLSALLVFEADLAWALLALFAAEVVTLLLLAGKPTGRADTFGS